MEKIYLDAEAYTGESSRIYVHMYVGIIQRQIFNVPKSEGSLLLVYLAI